MRPIYNCVENMAIAAAEKLSMGEVTEAGECLQTAVRLVDGLTHQQLDPKLKERLDVWRKDVKEYLRAEHALRQHGIEVDEMANNGEISRLQQSLFATAITVYGVQEHIALHKNEEQEGKCR